MIHPNCELRRISDALGFGVFATARIPRGTIVYAKDALEIEISPEAFAGLDANMRPIVDKYSYIDAAGNRIVSWDLAKYVNHRCDCNTMSSGWGFEIALRDIEAGEEITDEYGLFNIEEPMRLDCGCRGCRGVLLPDDVERHYRRWDRKVRDAVRRAVDVEQPLWLLLEDTTRYEVEAFARGVGRYRSVRELTWVREETAVERAEAV